MIRATMKKVCFRPFLILTEGTDLRDIMITSFHINSINKYN
ncbi:hypothetical protein HMPREF0868_0968 [Mageeibacillus indolicus UPII9-5]|uniref:Uncharacterized protein n=1 Tax=Mageeibacillus indolicus (strain UPII9-5) TaxID=699246 RepID=D3R266_MAGIU|nr:hypothetical protein HMPREF0868_0968 [Mageeibacillus indolicus UPII9-5]